MTTYLIVGGAGFVGSHLARFLVRQGKEVHIVVSETTSRYRVSNIESELGIHFATLHDLDELHRIFNTVRPEVVFHLPAATVLAGKGEMFEDARCALDDITRLLNVLCAAESTIRPPALLIRVGTLAEYGTGSHPFREIQREQPVSPHAAGMVLATHMSDVVQRDLSFPIINVRLALAYGPGQSTKCLVPQLVENCIRGETTRVWYPEERRDLIHIDDVTSALAILTNKPPISHRTINIATGHAPTMREVAELVLEYTGAEKSTVDFGSGTSPDGIANSIGSTELMEKLYSWNAQIGIREGMLRLVRAASADIHDRDGVAV